LKRTENFIQKLSRMNDSRNYRALKRTENFIQKLSTRNKQNSDHSKQHQFQRNVVLFYFIDLLSALVSIFPRSAALKAERLRQNRRQRHCGATLLSSLFRLSSRQSWWFGFHRACRVFSLFLNYCSRAARCSSCRSLGYIFF